MSLTSEDGIHESRLSIDSSYTTSPRRITDSTGAKAEQTTPASVDTQDFGSGNSQSLDSATNGHHLEPFMRRGEDGLPTTRPETPTPKSRNKDMKDKPAVHVDSTDLDGEKSGVSTAPAVRFAQSTEADGFPTSASIAAKQTRDPIKSSTIAAASHYNPPTVDLDAGPSSPNHDGLKIPILSNPPEINTSIDASQTQTSESPQKPKGMDNGDSKTGRKDTANNEVPSLKSGRALGKLSLNKASVSLLSKDPLDSYAPLDFAPISQPTSKFATFLEDDPKNNLKKKTARARFVGLGQEIISMNKRLKTQYKYTPLEPEEVRFLLLQPHNNQKDSEIKCTVLRRKLDDPNINGKFHALSYHWGSGPPTEEIYLVEHQPDNKAFKEVLRADLGVNDAKIDLGRLGELARQSTMEKWFMVRKTLWDAMKALRQPKEPVLLWVDAICINQEPVSKAAQKERDAQVTLFAHIYSAAYNVCVWLGEGNETSNRGMRFIRSIMDIPSLDLYVQASEHIQDWKAIRTIMSAKWFSRRWVVQEICMARKATVHMGNEAVNWEDFADAIALFMEKIDIIKTKFPYSEKFRDVAGLGANQLVAAISNLSYRTPDGFVTRHNVGIESLVCSLVYFETSRPQDIIYSLLSIAKDTPQSFLGIHSPQIPLNDAEFPVEVAYASDPMDIMDLFLAFTRQCIKTSKSLDIICRCWAPELFREKRVGGQIISQKLRYPSWVQKISDSSFGRAEEALRGRKGGDSLVGCPFRTASKTYDACKGSEAGDPFEDDISAMLQSDSMFDSAHDSDASEDSLSSPIMSRQNSMNLNANRILRVQGVELARIKRRSDRITNGNIPAKWLKIAGYRPTPEKKHIVPDKLWRTLVADRGPDGQFPPRWYKRACQHCLNDPDIISPTDDLDTEAPTDSDIMQQFLSRVRTVVWNRQFFHTGRDTGKDDGYFGLMPEKARKNDLVCLLEGCTVPVILHPITPQGTDVYELVGECYVYGAMDGEVFPASLTRSFYLV